MVLTFNSRCVDVGDLGVLGRAPAGGAAHVQPHPARGRNGGGGGGGPGVAVVGQQDPHALHAVAVAALEGKIGAGHFREWTNVE